MRFRCGNWQDNCKNRCDDFYCLECIKKERDLYVAHLNKDDLPKNSDMTTGQRALYQGLTQEDVYGLRKILGDALADNDKLNVQGEKNET